MAAVRPQPLITVADVPRASRWYQVLLDTVSGHGGDEYERLFVDGELVLQLHRDDVGHHHGQIGDPTQPVGNGFALWFAVTDFDSAVERLRSLNPELVHDVHVNPNARQREIWARDPDGYLVVIAESV